MQITKRHFGDLSNGTKIYAYDLQTSGGLSATVLNYGAILQNLCFKSRDLVLGYDTLKPYTKNPAYFGAAIGRVANRIRNGKFDIDATSYQLPLNEGKHSLHSGPQAFEHAIWNVDIQENRLILNHICPKNSNGFPGTLRIAYHFTLAHDALHIDIIAHTDEATLCNPTYHSYFNLDIIQKTSPLTIDSQNLKLFAAYYTPVGQDNLPLGTVHSVHGTKFDFTKKASLNTRILDHNFVIPPEENSPRLRPVAELTNDTIRLTVESTLPGLQIYTGDFIETQIGKNGAGYGPRSGLAIEPQYFPDAPNCPAFPSIILRPGETYSEIIRYVLSSCKTKSP